MNIGRICVCVIAVMLLCSGCSEHMSAEDIENIQPMTRREFELAYKDEMKSQLYNRFMNYVRGDNVVNYEITRGSNVVRGTYFEIGGITVVEDVDCCYFKNNGKKYKVSESVEEYIGEINIDIDTTISTLVKHIDETYLEEIGRNDERHSSDKGVDEIFRNGSTTGGNRTDINILYLRNHIHIEFFDNEKNTSTVMDMGFSAPTASQHNVVEKINEFIKIGGDVDADKT